MYTERTWSVCGVCLGEYCVTEKYYGAYAAFALYDKCYVAYNDADTSYGVLWFDAQHRSVRHQ